MRNFSQEIFKERYATSINMDLADWELRWAEDVRAREAELKEMKEKYQADVLEMGDKPLLCCPEDHRCKGSCKADKNSLLLLRTSGVPGVPTLFAEEAAVTDGAHE